MAETDSSQLKATDMLNRVMAETYAMSREYGPQSNKYDDRCTRRLGCQMPRKQLRRVAGELPQAG